jgi:CDP-glycerol glycerophosphotransferase
VLLTIVLVVIRHQAWVRPCLRSILDQAVGDVDVLVVDNASTDHAVRIVAEVAAAESSVRLERLEAKVPQSVALQTGANEACGEYVWFLDPADLALAGGLRRVVEALDGRPDVLLVREVIRDLYGKEVAGPEPGRRPLLRDRVFRRDDARSLLTLWAGGFAQVPVATAVLARATSVVTVPQPVVAHRDLPAAVVRQWEQDDPFDVFAAYDAAFAALDSAARDAVPSGSPASPTALDPEADQPRSELAKSMLAHQRSLLSRVPAGRRREFFHLMSASMATQSGGLQRPRRRAARAELDAIAANRYDVYSGLRRRHRTRTSGLPAMIGRARRKMRDLPRSRAALRARGLSAWYAWQRRRPLVGDLAVYMAYWGGACSCNPRAIYEKARELVPEVRGVWVVKPGSVAAAPPEADHVVLGTAAYYRLMARATFFVNNVNFANDIVKRPGQLHLQTHHGTPLKTMGLDLAQAKHSTLGINLRRLMARVERWDISVSANEFSTEIWERVYPSGTYRSIETGYPRNDVLVNHTAEHRDRVRAELGLEPEQTAVIYAPTHREYVKEYLPLLDVDALAESLGPSHVILVRQHYFYAPGGIAPGSGHVRDVSSHPSIEDLSIASDVLVTDYSSLMFDYAVLDRPIVVYAPDWSTYRSERGTYFDLMAEPPGAVTATQEGLTDLLRTGEQASAANTALRQKFRAKFCALEDGRAAERVVRAVWPAQPHDAASLCRSTVE